MLPLLLPLLLALLLLLLLAAGTAVGLLSPHDAGRDSAASWPSFRPWYVYSNYGMQKLRTGGERRHGVQFSEEQKKPVLRVLQAHPEIEWAPPCVQSPIELQMHGRLRDRLLRRCCCWLL